MLLKEVKQSYDYEKAPSRVVKGKEPRLWNRFASDSMLSAQGSSIVQSGVLSTYKRIELVDDPSYGAKNDSSRPLRPSHRLYSYGIYISRYKMYSISLLSKTSLAIRWQRTQMYATVNTWNSQKGSFTFFMKNKLNSSHPSNIHSAYISR